MSTAEEEMENDEPKLSNQLVQIVSASGLEESKSKFILDRFKDYFELADEWATKAKAIKVTRPDQLEEMKKARNGRLFLRAKRLNIEDCRKELKEQSLREGRAIDGISNVLKALIVPIEDYLERQEKFVEFQEAEKQRLIQEEVQKKMEADRLEQERKAAEEQKRIREENERLKKENEEKNRQIKEQEEKQKRELEEERKKQQAIVDEERKKRQAAEQEAEKRRQEEEKRKEIMNGSDDIGKLVLLRGELKSITIPDVKDAEARKMVKTVESYLGMAILAIKTKTEEEF